MTIDTRTDGGTAKSQTKTGTARMSNQMDLFALAIFSFDPINDRISIAADFTIAQSKEEAETTGVVKAKERWPEGINHRCKVSELKSTRIIERATELEWLQWFHSWADFGPAEGDARESLRAQFMRETGKNLPEGYNLAEDGETVIDMEVSE